LAQPFLPHEHWHVDILYLNICGTFFNLCSLLDGCSRSKDFNVFIRLSGMTHIKTSPYYPQSNGKLERFHKTLKGECIRAKTPLSLDEAKRLVEDVTHTAPSGSTALETTSRRRTN
jgi:hypothetical protein